MKQKIRTLIAEGQTKEALDLLLQQKPDDATLLLGRYHRVQREYQTGIIDHNTYALEMARINHAAVALAPEQDPSISPQRPKVFISYNHADASVARRIRDFLRQNGVEVIIDEENMPAGMSIMNFIQESVRACDAVLSIVSERSLKSGWVGQESVSALYATWLADKKFLPVRLDGAVLDIDFQLTAQEMLQQRLQELDAKIERLRRLGGDTRAFDEDRERLFELKNNLGKIIHSMKNVLAPDISGDNFESGMRQVLARICEQS